MPSSPRPSNSESSGKGPKPSPRETIERVRAAAVPRLEQARETAGPKVEKAAQAAGGFLGLLRDRAKETARHFADGYAEEDPARVAGSDGQAAPPASESARPRPRPRPGPRAD